MQSFDVVIIGGGPGGMNTGFMLRQAGKSVAMIQEEDDCFGGVCLNRGCMPTKSMLKAAKAYRYAKQAQNYGLDMVVEPVNLERVRAVADQDIAMLGGMVAGMIGQAQIVSFRGMGSFQSAHEVTIRKRDGSSETIRGEHIIVATGSRPVEMPMAPFDGEHILSSDELLRNTELPGSLLIVGGGAVGCEFATLYNTFGSRVVLVEALETLLPREDREAGQALQSAFEKEGIEVKTGTLIDRLEVTGGKVRVHYVGRDATDTVDKVLVGIGRRPNTEGLNLEAAGVKTTEGAIAVNSRLQTSVPHIYALGDVIGGLTLSHAAEKQAQLLVTNLVQGTSDSMKEETVPRVAFSHPEVAAVGVRDAGAGIRAFTLAQVPNGRSVVDKVSPAFVKLFVSEETSRLAG
ncbi:MAG: NAD(P)/FAD-dependent oxidoreductase, partial [Desulfuromonadales bacterium]|nr:NAD(P)/FAD-dependent oxidoreductase [Desulfuromonadales bacterium]